MLIRLIFVFLSFLIGQNLQAAAPQCFNYETYAHQGPAAPLAPNQSLLNYSLLEITARHAAIPVLAAGAHQVGISLMQHGVPPILWQHHLFLLGAILNLQEACQMAVERQALGIIVDFEYPLIIAAIAAGAPPPLPHPPAGIPVYLNHALTGGGYLASHAAAIFRLRHNIPQPNFVNLVVPAGGAPANCIVIHFHNDVRVSKNLKELSHNSLPSPLPAGYLTIKDMIENQFAALGLPGAYSSATIVSADFLQPN